MHYDWNLSKFLILGGRTFFSVKTPGMKRLQLNVGRLG